MLVGESVVSFAPAEFHDLFFASPTSKILHKTKKTSEVTDWEEDL